jgi:phosphoribosylglycinamide formyltransferase-1
MKIIILTGSEIRHEYFRKNIANDKRISVLASYCEGPEKSLGNRVRNNAHSSKLEIQHVEARLQSEIDFFSDYIASADDKSNPKFIKKGGINDFEIVNEIIELKPDLLVCYGSSIIKSELLTIFKNKFINVHLGLSPYYRGSGTNVWPLINSEPDMIGATFMFIDAGIDTGKIIHQIRADILLGDSPHSIGNRLIRKMTSTYANVIANFEYLEEERQPEIKGKLYLKKDFNSNSCRELYYNLEQGLIKKYINSAKDLPYIVSNKGLL